jgi:hypothetical protein
MSRLVPSILPRRTRRDKGIRRKPARARPSRVPIVIARHGSKLVVKVRGPSGRLELRYLTRPYDASSTHDGKRL